MSGHLVLELLLAAFCVLWLVGAGFGWRVLRVLPALWSLSRDGRLPPPVADRAAREDRAQGGQPFLSVIVPASNEAGDDVSIAELRAAHASRLIAAAQLAGAGPGLTTEMLYVEDRSTDATGAVLDGFAAANVATAATAGTVGAAAATGVTVRVLHIHELPEGWLGKTNAMQRGVEAGRSEWVLLTDADVRLGPDALLLALGHAQAQGLDHLVLTPQLEPGGLLRDATLSAFSRFFALNLAAVNDPASRASVGIGAFNLVRREALLRIGGLRPVRFEVGDDMALGAALRRSGARQGVASGRELVQLAWYRTAGGIVRGLDKGIFAYGGKCRSWRLFLGAAFLLLLELAPWIAMGLGFGAAFEAHAGGESAATAPWPLALGLLGATALALGIGVVALGERWMGRRMLPALFVPLGGLVMTWAVFRAGWMGWWRGGVLWRGTLYPSALLREAMASDGGEGRA